MPDYGHGLLFGTFVTPSADHADTVITLAQTADQVGLDVFTLQDHPYQPAFLDTWTLLSFIAGQTNRVRLMPNVASLPMRPPAVLARAVASLDILSGGRVELGLGAGTFWDAIAAMGGPRRSPGEAVSALSEAIQVIRALWMPGSRIRLDGAHYRLAGAKPGPFPAHAIQIWIGAYKKRMLALIGRIADGWVPSSPYAPPDQLTQMNAVIDRAARAAGRDPVAVRRIYNIAGSFDTNGHGFLQGPPRVWVEQVADLVISEGMSGFVLSTDDDSTIRRFAAEVVPGVRELVARQRVS
jgi:alkanesulfonate monooxygenase SsuD/methylene tetrahydromethanopterin reductase-like flavin-dependent oxidoreductase (luciferase family)